MDKKVHLANTNERSKKIYKVKSISVKQAKYKKKEEIGSYAAQSQKSSSEKAKQSESYSVYQKGHKKSTVKSDEVRSYRSDNDDSAEKDKYRKQMQFTSFQQKAAEMNSKLSSDIQVNIETAKKQASVSSYQSVNSSNPQYSDKTKEAAAMLANRLAGDILRKTQINDGSQTKAEHSPLGNAKPPKSQRVCFYLNSNQVEKARLMKPDSTARDRFNKAADNTYKEREKIKAEIAKENNKIHKYQKETKKIEKQASKPHTTAFEKVENALYLEGKISGAANKDSTGEAAAALSAVAAEIAAKKVIEEAAKKHKSIGQISRASGAVGELSSSIERESSVGSAAASAFTSVPKYYVAQKAADTVKKASQKHYKDKLDKKRDALRAKQRAAEKRIEELKKEQVKRQVKINIYKTENGITSTSNSSVQNIKAVIKSQQKVAKAAAAAKTSATIIAAAGGVLFPILGIVVIIIVITALFSWIIPHEENIYNESNNTWEAVMVETNEEILKGYIKHIQDYFDKKQLEILEVIDINFDGFTPDKYDYAKMEDKGGVLDFEERPSLTTEYTEHYIEKKATYKVVTGMTPGDRNNPSGTPIWSTETKQGESTAIMRTEYYKFDYDNGYEVRTTSLDYDFSRTYLLCGIDIEAYWNSQNIGNEGFGSKGSVVFDDGTPKFVCENGKFSNQQDITDEKMVLRKEGIVVYEGSVLTYVLSHPELFDHFVTLSGGNSSSLVSSNTNWKERTITEIISDEQYVFTNYIWNLYEYGNQWIKLSDDCDFEHIIAMAAIKKWQEIEADGFDANTYSFEITDDDLDYCLDNLYEFYYSYRSGRCRYNNCHKYITGDPPKIQFTCNRATTHKHLIGQVTNYELIGGVDFALNKILKTPKRSDYSSEDEYNKAKEQFETDKEIYEVYAEYISDELGTSTKLPDYENDRDAQYRLLRMHQAGNGKKPSNPPTNVQCSVRREIKSETVTGSDNTGGYTSTHDWTKKVEHYYLDVSWNAPAPEEYSKGKFVEISGYHIYAYNRSTGSKKRIATTASTSCSIDYLDGSRNGRKKMNYEDAEIERADGSKVIMSRIKTEEYIFTNLPQYTHIIVEAFNDGGSSPQSDPLYVIIQ